LFVSGWIFAGLGAIGYIEESTSLFLAALVWFAAVLIFIWKRVENYRLNRLSLQSDWEEFYGESETEYTALPDPSEFELDIPL
jgi:hypothetical protein